MNPWGTPSHPLQSEQELTLQLETSRQVLKALFDGTQSAIFIVSADYKIIFFNKKAIDRSALLCGQHIKIGDNILHFNLSPEKEKLFEVMKNNFELALSGSQVVSERELDYAEKKIWIQSEYTPIYDQQKVIAVVLRIKEINERKHYEQQIENQNEKLKQIAWIQSHETRQPVATILGLINVLDKKTLTEDNKIIIEMLEKTVEQLDEVIRNTVIRANSMERGR